MDERIRKYARFLIQGCLGLKKQDKLFIIGTTLIQEFIDVVIYEARNLGILEIETLISDPDKQKELYLKGDYKEIINNENFDKSKYNKMAREGYAFLNIYSPMPGFFTSVNPELLSKVDYFMMDTIKEYRDYQNKGLIKWNISSASNLFWANSLGISEDELWEYILDICLINDEDPKELWENKMAKLRVRAEYLNNLNIDRLIYRNSLGTNLEIGIPEGYLFQSADSGVIVNMPTEEVFTSPDRCRVQGIVYSSKLLIHNNNEIADFWLKFRDGKIIDYDAREGKNILKGIIETDEGSRFLGEVAFVDYDSAISKTNIIFKNTLYDENASCHLAIGTSFPECIRDGLSKSIDELQDLGLNYSKEHVDFFIGTRDLNVKAVLKNGEEVVIMENGNFVERENL